VDRVCDESDESDATRHTRATRASARAAERGGSAVRAARAAEEPMTTVSRGESSSHIVGGGAASSPRATTNHGFFSDGRFDRSIDRSINRFQPDGGLGSGVQGQRWVLW
jgi:hypothetical protein